MPQLKTTTHSVVRKQFIKTLVGVAEGASGKEQAVPREETLYECNRRYETNCVFM